MPGDTWASGWAGLAGRWETDVGDGIPLGRIAGIRVAASWTLPIVVALLVLGLAGGVFPRDYPSLAPSWYVAAAVVGAGLFLVSLAHELAHALVARRAGVAVESITFWLFGGVARLAGDAASPVAALWIAVDVDRWGAAARR